MTDISTHLRQARSRRGPDPRQHPHWTWAESREWVDALSGYVGDWQGIPVPLGEDNPMVLAKGHPLRDFYRTLYTPRVPAEVRPPEPEEYSHSCSTTDVCEEERVVNEWFCRKRNLQVLVVDRDGKRYSLAYPVSPDRSMDRLTMWLQTIGAADAWDPEAERQARETLRAMLTERQWMHYDLTGSFFETSPRSRITYVFRRLRPTIAMSPRGKNGNNETMRCLAVMCLHPIGYYDRSWGGCMVPSDDVIAHVAWMRGDEANYWRHANQHAPSSPEAGL